MTDETVRVALRSDASLVVVEAPAGCGKTHQGADYAREVAPTVEGRLLILTHTHAACSVFADRTRKSGSRVEIRTIDSLIARIATAYHAGLGLPADVATWTRQNTDGYAQVALKVAGLLTRRSMIAASLAKRYPVVICDEHQDCSGDQHAVGMALLAHGARLRVFADPMQRIYRDRALIGSNPVCDWVALTKKQGRSNSSILLIAGRRVVRSLANGPCKRARRLWRAERSIYVAGCQRVCASYSLKIRRKEIWSTSSLRQIDNRSTRLKRRKNRSLY